MSEVDRVLAEAIAAHGGATLWQRLTAVRRFCQPTNSVRLYS
jgi:hypothetical protein